MKHCWINLIRRLIRLETLEAVPVASLPLYPTVPGSRIRLECREMVFPQPLSLELSTCQNISEDEVELEPPSLPSLTFSNLVLQMSRCHSDKSSYVYHLRHSTLGITVLVEKYYCLLNCVIFGFFFQNSESSKEMGTNCVLATKWLKIPYNIVTCLVVWYV